MNRRELIKGSRIVVDMCMAHGVWFDKGEISHASEYFRGSGASMSGDVIDVLLEQLF